jgi:flagellar basal-body rod modification protein FlgD
VSNVDPVSGAAAGTTATTAEAPRRNDQLGKDAFLKLLVAQLRYQDPLKPSDPGDFMSQTAQFTSVEKLEELARLSSTTSRSLSMSAAGNLIGRTVSWFAEDGSTASGKVTAALPSADGAKLLVGTEEVPLDGVIRIA